MKWPGWFTGEFFGTFLLVFFGVRSYRDNVAGGTVSFGKALLVGLLITVVSCVCYVVTWEILYFNFLPDFVEKYSAYTIERAKTAGASAASIQAQVEEMKKFKEMYNNPIYNAAITFVEPLPVGLLVTLLSGVVLRTKAGPRRGTAVRVEAQ